MPELFIECPDCLDRGYRDPCKTCESTGFVRYGTETGHEHVWMTTDVQPLEDRRGWWQGNNVMRARHVSCACGKTAAETTA